MDQMSHRKSHKQAVVILHGMGEQIPMQTLESFIEAVWTTDLSLSDPGKPDPDTGQARRRNASWGKPDPRNHSFELRRITTEAAKNRRKTDFYEYYWADLMHDTTWEQVRAWIVDLLWRNPARRVPRRVLAAWIVLWIIALGVIAMALAGMIPADPEAPKPGPLRAILGGLAALAVAGFVSNVLVKRFGDVARYVKAKPPNVARRQEIRSNGVQLLEELMVSKTQDGKPQYDRIILVAHSLGTIVAYDILTQLFARHNDKLTAAAQLQDSTQPERDQLEQMIRAAAGLAVDKDTPAAPATTLDIDQFQAQQSACLAEAQAQGSPWIVSDFITLGSPLTHAEFLMAENRDEMRARQATRVLPVCPPRLEFDQTTDLWHFSFGGSNKPLQRRLPHHAALFAYTRWTNLYSDQRKILWGDLISGPLAETFGLQMQDDKGQAQLVCGIKDIAVLPGLDSVGNPLPGERRHMLTHNHYWDLTKGGPPMAAPGGRAAGEAGGSHATGGIAGTANPPPHIVALRKALRLLD